MEHDKRPGSPRTSMLGWEGFEDSTWRRKRASGSVLVQVPVIADADRDLGRSATTADNEAYSGGLQCDRTVVGAGTSHGAVSHSSAAAMKLICPVNVGMAVESRALSA
jgi:hypothetical protein